MATFWNTYLSTFLKIISFNLINLPIYSPSFKEYCDHWCVHAGGKGIIDSVKSCLDLKEEEVKVSREILYECGNVSSSSIFYELKHLLRHSPLKRGDKIVQIALGSGFKCNTSLLTSLVDTIPLESSCSMEEEGDSCEK